MAHCPNCANPVPAKTIIKMATTKMSHVCEKCSSRLWISENKITSTTITLTGLTIALFCFAILLKPTHFWLSIALIVLALVCFFATLWRYYYDTVFEVKR